MLTFKRAVVAVAFFFTFIYLVSRSHEDPANPKPPLTPSAQKKHDLTGTSRPSTTGSSSGYRLEDSIRISHQKPMMELPRMTLQDKLAYQFPYDAESKFPAYIWQTWKWTPADREFMFRDQEATWTEQHPGFIHEVITDDVAVNLLRMLYAGTPEVMDAYLALPLPVLRADFFRYLILLARGGIYSDIDTHAIRSALEWVPDHISRESYGLVIGIEADPDRPDWQDWYSRRIQFCQWTIQAKPGHPALREVVAHITEETLKRQRDGQLDHTADRNVVEFTGPALWTDVVFDYFNDDRYFDKSKSKGPISWRNFTGMETPKKVGDVIVLPITSFSPGVQQMGAKDFDDPMAFVRHDFEGTWKPESERHIGEQT